MKDPLDNPDFDPVAVEFFRAFLEQEIRLINSDASREVIDAAKLHWHAAALHLCHLFIKHGVSRDRLNTMISYAGMPLMANGQWQAAVQLCKLRPTAAE
jgi:hypothetical protein